MKPLAETNEVRRWDGQSPEEVANHLGLHSTSLRERQHARASQALLTRILDLHNAGRSPEEIAAEILTTEPENVVFRSAILIEMILHYVNRDAFERIL